MWKNHRQPQQPGNSSSCWSPAWSHTAVGWHPILQPAFVTSQPTWLCWSLWHQPKLIPQVFNGVEVRTTSRPFHPLHSHILQVVSDKPQPVGESVVILEDRVRSQTVEIWDCHWLQNLISLSLCIEIASNDDKPCFSSEGDATPHHHTASTKRCYSIGAAISIAFSASSPHFDPTIQLP